MLALTPAQLKKKNSTTGEQRIDILLDACRNNKTLIHADTEKEFTLANSSENQDAIKEFTKIGKAFILITSTGEELSSSKIGKSGLFGGDGAGAGGGTKQTAIAESLQCIYCQIIVEKPDITLDKITKTKLKAAFAKVQVGSTTFDQCYNLDSGWHASAFWGATLLREKGYINSNHVFHRDSADMKQIYALAKRAFQNSDIPPMKDDKWNPGDIWAIDKTAKLDQLPNSTIQELNNALLRNYFDKTIIGISLKKVNKEKFIKCAEINSTNKRPGGLKFDTVYISGKTTRANFFSAKSGECEYTGAGGVKGKLEIRANSDLGTLKAEITGKTARGGGAGWGKLQDFIAEHMSSTYRLPSNDQLKAEARTIKRGNAAPIKKIFSKAKRMDSSLDLKEFSDMLVSKDLAWIHSKIGVVYLCYAFHMNKSNKKSDKLVDSIVNYAGSQTALSSVHLKVYE